MESTPHKIWDNIPFEDPHNANDYVELVGGGLSKRGNDQVTEAAHQYLEWKNLVIR